MNRWIKIVGLGGLPVLMLCVLASGCEQPLGSQEPTVPNRPAQINDDVRALASSQGAFGWDLYRALSRQPGNLFYSPTSVAVAMSMVMNGASGETHEEIMKGLRVSLPEVDYHAAAGELIVLLNAQSKGVQLRTANRLWGQANVAFRGDFLERLQNQYWAPLGQVDFEREPEAARRAINQWVTEYTAQRIKDLFPEGTIDKDTRLVLANAIYFKGDWKLPFATNQTRPVDFFMLDGQSRSTPMMRATENFLYAEDDLVQVVSLPYASGGLSLVVILPKARDGLPALESKWSAEYANELLASLASRRVQLGIPKFRLESSFVLNEMLQQLGMVRAFTEAAQFDRMTTEVPLMISVVVHKAFVMVNEEGTEAAAATGVGMKVASEPVREEPIPFVADHPFIFFVRHEGSGAVLFAGRLVEPAAP